MYQELIVQILETVAIPLLAALTTFAVKWLNARTEQLKEATNNDMLNKYIEMLKDTVTQCVIATNQTYVDSLKKSGEFSPESQRAAFELTYNAVMSILGDEAKIYLDTALGDLNAYVTNLIETNVKTNK